MCDYSNSTGWNYFGENASVGNGTYRQRYTGALWNGQWWYWKVKAESTSGTTWSPIYKFYTGRESKIVNTGTTNITGFVYIEAQYFDEGYQEWLPDVTVVNETQLRQIGVGGVLPLDEIFNAQELRANELHPENVPHRLVVTLQDSDGNILRCDDGRLMMASWEFTVDGW